jgi:uncharacterized LabA/DUF88 family protein
MIIDAMDLLYSDKVDGFCIVSSDSDFTSFSNQTSWIWNESSGIGEQKTPNSFIVACDRFVYIEVLDGAIKERTKRTATDAKRPHQKP